MRRGRRVRIAGLDIGTDIQLIILAGVAVGGYYIYRKISSTPNPLAPTSGAAQTNASTVASDLAAAQADGNSLSYPKTQYQQWADDIYSAASAWAPQLSDSTSVMNIIEQINNDADWLALVQAFGTRTIYRYYSFSQSDYTLGPFLDYVFPSSVVASINQQLGWNGVTLTI